MTILTDLKAKRSTHVGVPGLAASDQPAAETPPAAPVTPTETPATSTESVAKEVLPIEKSLVQRARIKAGLPPKPDDQPAATVESVTPATAAPEAAVKQSVPASKVLEGMIAIQREIIARQKSKSPAK